MAYKTLQLRRDTAANWTSTNPTLAEGEIGVETDTLKFKIGDGSTAWADLDYAAIKPDDQANSVYFGSWESKSSDTVYQAESDGFVLAYNTAGSHMKILTDSSNPPTTVRQDHYHSDGVGGWHISAVCPVRKGDYWKVEKASSVYWLPVELALLLAANFQIPDDGYIGSVSSPHAIQIEADGDVVLSQNLYLADGKSIGQSAGPLLTFDDANNKLNISGCNIGIGTTAGNSRLIVSLDTDFPTTPTDPPVVEITGNNQLPLLFRGTKSCYIKGDDGGHFVMGAEDYIAYEAGGFGILYERMRITPDGKVGIGTQNPNSLLDVAGDAEIGGSLDVTDEIVTTSYIEIGGPIAGGLTGPNRLFIDTEPSTGKSRFFCYGKDTSTRGQFEISLRKSDGGDNLQAFLIDSDGKVGIGTTPSDSRLKVHLDTDFPTTPTDPPVMEITGNNQLALLFSSTKSCYVKGDNGGNFVMGAEGFVAYETGGFGAAYERMRVTPEGKVGIGTSTPGSLLDVAGDVNIGGSFQVNTSTTHILMGKEGAANLAALNVRGEGDAANYSAVRLGNVNGTEAWEILFEKSARKLNFGKIGTSSGIKFTLKEDGGVIIHNIKSGATQAAAGAAAGELWKTNGHASLPNNVVMIGV